MFDPNTLVDLHSTIYDTNKFVCGVKPDGSSDQPEGENHDEWVTEIQHPRHEVHDVELKEKKRHVRVCKAFFIHLTYPIVIF